MKKLILFVLSAILSVIGCASQKTSLPVSETSAPVPDIRWYNPAATSFSISTADELAGLSQIVSGARGDTSIRDNFSGKTITLTGNIDLSKYGNWIPIGSENNPFAGTFDGGWHVISKLTINRPNASYQGLFGRIRSGEVKNLGLDSVSIHGGGAVGGLAGGIYGSSSVTNSYSTGSVSSIGNQVGGLVGRVVDNSKVANSYSTARVSGAQWVGGVVGIVRDNSSLSHSYSTGNVSGTSYYIGGVTGSLYDGGSVIGSYSTGTVNGASDCVGGVVGYVSGNSNVLNNYSISPVSGVNNVGGIAGWVIRDSRVVNNAALNPEVKGTGKDVERVVGFTSALRKDAMLNNIAYVGMKNKGGDIEWANKGSDRWGGADVTADIIKADGTLGGRFIGSNGWTTENGKLPGFGATVEFSTHFIDVPTIVTDTRWYSEAIAANPDTTNFIISTAAELAGLAQIVNGAWLGTPTRDNFSGKSITIANNINLSSYNNWVPIGNYHGVFSGTFNGGGKVISNLTINRNARLQGLFGVIDNGKLENIRLDSVNISGGDFVGGIAAAVNDGSIDNCYSTGVVWGADGVGGVVGLISNSKVSNCYSTAKVSGTNSVGGAIGTIGKSGSVTNCYATGAVRGNNFVGGVVGGVIDSSSVTNCVALNPDLKGKNVGRVVGGVEDANKSTLSNNAAWVGVRNDDGKTTWSNKGATAKDGEDIVALIRDGTLGKRFVKGSVWTPENGKLPGLGKPVDIPAHLR